MDTLEALTYTVPQAAAVLQCGDDTIYRLVKDGVIPTVPGMGRRTLISRQWLAHWVETAGTDSGRSETGAASGDPATGRDGNEEGFRAGARPDTFGRSETGTASEESAATAGRDAGGEGPASGARPNTREEKDATGPGAHRARVA